MSKYFFFLVIFMTNIIYCQSTDNKQKAYNTAVKAINQMDQGDVDGAIKLLEESIQLDSENPAYPYEMSYAYYLKKDYTKVIEILENTLSMDNIKDEYYQMLGNAYDIKGDSLKAIETYNKGLSVFPNSGKLYLELGNMNLGNVNKALSYYETGIKVDPNFPSNYYWAAKIFLKSTDEIWGVIYGELFMNLERGSERTEEMSKLLFSTYSSEIKFTNDTSINVSFYQNSQFSSLGNLSDLKLPFGMVFETTLLLSTLGENQINIQSLTRIRERFIKEYYKKNYNATYPNVLFEWHKNLIDKNLFESYNYWLFMKGDESEFENYYESNEANFNNFIQWFKSNSIMIGDNKKFVRTE